MMHLATSLLFRSAIKINCKIFSILIDVPLGYSVSYPYRGMEVRFHEFHQSGRTGLLCDQERLNTIVYNLKRGLKL